MDGMRRGSGAGNVSGDFWGGRNTDASVTQKGKKSLWLLVLTCNLGICLPDRLRLMAGGSFLVKLKVEYDPEQDYIANYKGEFHYCQGRGAC